MSWLPSRASIRRLAFGALFATAAASAAANVLVVRSAGPSAKSYPPGRSLPDNARVTLREGDTLVVLDARGTRTFRGAGTYALASAPQANTRTVATSDGRRARIGAVRSAGIVPVSPTTIWHVDVTQSGNMCLTSTNEVMLWRPDPAETITLTITGPTGRRQVEWPAGRATIAWPSDLAITGGAEYSLQHPGVAVPSRVTFRTLNSTPDDMQSVAQALLQNECREQLDLLVDSAPTQ